MGHKINPNSYRFGITKDWNTRWFVKNSTPALLQQDEIIRKAIKDKISAAGIDSIIIERNRSSCRVFIKVAKPGLVIGRGGKGIEELTAAVQKALKKSVQNTKTVLTNMTLTVEELKRNDVSASVLAQQISEDLKKRLPFRRTMKRYLESVMQNRDVQGAKVRLSGRLDGGEIARSEWLVRGKLPLTTLRSKIDYGEATTFASYGAVGIKVWLYKGEL